jgi:thiamine-phosphate pyrophosphorylase
VTRHRVDLRLVLVADAAACGDRDPADVARAAVDGGATTVQVRAKDESAARFLRVVAEVTAAVGDRATVIVNDRVDVFLAARDQGVPVHGVHLGQSDLPVTTVRRLIGADAVIGLTSHTTAHLAAVAALEDETVDYLGVGVIRGTATKPDHPTPIGVAGFAVFAGMAPLPCVAIGGVRPGDPARVRAAGGAGVAVASGVCAAPDPRVAAAGLRAEWDRG